MTTYQCIDDLRKFGFDPLTGEACGLAMRCLVDLNEEAIEIWKAFTRSDPRNDGWNNGKASPMIPYSMFQDLWTFAHVMRGTRYVFLGDWVHSKEWTETKYDLNDGPVVHKHPVETWKPCVWAIDDEEQMEQIRLNVEAGSFYIRRFYRKSNHPEQESTTNTQCQEGSNNVYQDFFIRTI